MTALGTLTFVHVLLSLVGIVTGFVVISGILAGQRRDVWTAVFLATTVATSVSGYLFPADRVLPSHILGLISLTVLAVAIVARYSKHLAGKWGPTYAVAAVVSQYLNVFVLVVQLFMKVPVLKALAPTQTEPVFATAQLVVFWAFAIVTTAAARRFTEQRTPRAVSR